MDNRYNRNQGRKPGKGGAGKQPQKKQQPAPKAVQEPKAGTLLTLTGEDGTEYQYDILASWTGLETGKRYMIYTDHEMDIDGNEQFYAAICRIADGELEILPVESDRDWEIVEAAAKELR